MESLPEPTNEEALDELVTKRDQIKEAHDGLAEKIIGEQKTYPFPGIDSAVYERMKADEANWPEIGDVPDDILRADDLIKEFAPNSIKVVWEPSRARLITEFAPNWIDVVPVDDVSVNDVFVVPAKEDSQFVFENSLFPWQLQIADGMDEDLKI